jgi:hypothetical protein
MFEHIEWTMFINATREKNALSVLHRFRKALDRDVSIVKCEHYWKDPSLFYAVVRSPLQIEDVANAILETLLACRRVTSTWSIGLPQEYIGNRWEFSGSTNEHISVYGIKLLDFRIVNFVSEEAE